MLGWELDEEDELTDEQWERASKLHRETVYAVHIILQLQTFEPGTYRSEKYSSTWVRVDG
jgi:hypothetical protein